MTSDNENQPDSEIPETIHIEGSGEDSTDTPGDGEGEGSDAPQLSDEAVSMPKEIRSNDVAPIKVLTDAEAAALAGNISKGSPFAAGTALRLDIVGQQVDFETGVWRETILGGLFASGVMLLFSIPSIFFFPNGAVMISALGCLLGMMALASRRPLLALGATCANLLVLALGFSRSMF